MDGKETIMDAVTTKVVRAKLQDIITAIQNSEIKSRETSLAVTKLQEGKMWLGMHLGTLPEGGEDLNAKRDAEQLQAGITKA